MYNYLVKFLCILMNARKREVNRLSKQTKISKKDTDKAIGQRSSNGKSATNGSHPKTEMSAADKATLKAWRVTFESRNKVCTD